ncbi:glycosyltransferase [Yoonia maritima]|uniref:capsular polysaccharide export protein, LipB/KpsS family n=1 Tax=Yoonia maritima TaxID=1435347 RepID=UPI000D0F490A|nr:glycosyltransferase [Yoonia maritima]
MPNENHIAFEKFDDHLRLARNEGVNDPEFDFRDWVISNRYQAWNVGYFEANLTKRYGANLRKLFPNALGIEDKRHGKSQHYMISGTMYKDPEKSHKGGVKTLQSFQTGDTLLFLEQGFLASTHSWSESFKANDPKLGCLGYVYDDMSYYYMADYPNRLIHRMNSNNELSDEEVSRTRAVMARIVEQKISKYNSQPIVMPAMSDGYDDRVLVCDQAFADASTIYGKLTERDFEKMLLAAIRENPDSQILIKTHPDTHWEKGKRAGYFNHLEDVGRIRILRDPVNPYSLFNCVNKVYVGSSQMGLEALFAGKEVICFGAPFYAGWGLTDDRQTIPHRHRKRSLEEVFHYFYIWYTIYHVPNCVIPSSIEDAIDFIEQNRPVKMPIGAQNECDIPSVSVILPVYGVEKYIDQCLKSIRNQSLKEIEIITVNDCSLDGSQAIIDRHAAEDSRIRPIVLNKNAGQGFARNVGVESARGEYVFFLDSDDLFYDEHILKRTLQAANGDQSEMVRVQKVVFQDKTSHKSGKLDGNERYFQEQKIVPNSNKSAEILKSWHVWQFLYKRELLTKHDIKFKSGQWEERGFVCECYRHTNQITCLPLPGVAYRKRSDSTMSKVRTENDLAMFLTNIESVQKSMRGSAAEGFARYQMINALMLPQWWKTVQQVASKKGEANTLNRIALAFGSPESGDDADLSDFPSLNLQRPRLLLALQAIYTSRWDILEIAADRKEIPQAEYLAEMLHNPENDEERILQEALSLYARNELVATDRDAVLHSKTIEKKPKLLIHIGSTKTGSTFIQHFLEQNRAALLRDGVYVPEVGLFWQKTRPHKQAGHANFVPEAVHGKSNLKEHVDAAVSLMDDRIHTVILSSEAYFLNPNAIELARHFSDYDVEMVTYLRRQDDWANSQYAEFVAGGAVGRVDKSIEDWLETDQTRNRMDYYGRIKLWETVINKSKIHIGIYDREQLNDGDIISDFLMLTHLEKYADLPRPEARKENQFPFGTAHVNLIRRLNKNDWSDRNAYFNFIEEAGRKVTELRELKKNISASKLNLLTNTQRSSIMLEVENTNKNLAIEFLGRQDGTLFAPVIPKNDDILDFISNDEFDAIMRANDKWAPKKKASNTQSLKGVKKKDNLEAALTNFTPFKVTDSLSFKTFSLISYPFLSRKKRKKLHEQPRKFFNDSRSSYLRAIYRVINWEKSKRSRDDESDGSLFPTHKTLVVKSIRLCGRKMSGQKLAKLNNSPDLFFSDMSGIGANTVRRVLMIERRWRS